MTKYNSVAKADLSGKVYQKMVFNKNIVVLGPKTPQKQTKMLLEGKDALEGEKDAKRHSKTKIIDYVKTNTDLIYFVTYTFSSKKVGSRYDEKKIYEKMRDWLSDRVKRKNLKYILVPEQHQDGAWHFHGFTNLDLDWKYGHKRVKKVVKAGERERKINYITSYVSKDSVKFNGRRYLHSNNLQVPQKIYGNEDFEIADGVELEIKGLEGVKMKVE